MLGNPLAADIHRVFCNNIVKTSSIFNNYVAGTSVEDRILRFKRTERFVGAINKFFIKSGQQPLVVDSMNIDEKKLINFSLQLSGYIRDAQKSLNNLSDEYARDKDLIDLYRAAANYTVACNGKVPGNKYQFEHNKDYCFWRIDNPQKLDESSYMPVDMPLSPKRHTLILSMPFHIKPQESELRKWTYEYMHEALGNEIFGRDVDVYLVHFPIEQPRGEKFALTLDTINNHNNNFFEPMDLHLVNNCLKDFIGKDLVIDEKGNVLQGTPYTPKELNNNLRNLNFFGYCAGTAHAHRWLNAVKHIGSQLYPQETLDNAMSQVFVTSYAFLPFNEKNAYSGAHFMGNYGNDKGRKEPFVKMFNPEMYEKVKYQNEPGQARITVMPDRRNFIIATALPEDLLIIDRQKGFKHIKNQENGHHIAFLTTPNMASETNFICNMFTNVLENASLGYRGQDIFQPRSFHTPEQVLQNAALVGMRHNYNRLGFEL